jgi:nucleoside-diphosphate-sugar epimerase
MNAQHFYGAAKACAEILLRLYQSILSTAILRFYHPYGPHGDRFLINRLVRIVAEGQEVKMQGKDGIILNPVWIEDLAMGVCLAVESNQTGIFHFAGPETLTFRELVRAIGLIVNREPTIRIEPGDSIQRHAGAFEITRRVLGYSPQVSVWDGLRRLSDSALS